jgi:acetoin:2,6-dichlorophenolindophenol oxidoreductase subunit beta
MPTLEYRRAIRDALDEELARDPSVIFFGEDVAVAGGVFNTTGGLMETHGAERVFDTPISELAMAGAAFGAAVSGLRPVLEIMFGDFLFLVMDSIANQSAKYWYLSNEQASVPMVVRSAVGAGGRFGAIHSQMPIPWFQGIPGLKVVAPATPTEAKGLLKAAVRDENPVVFLEHKRLYSIKEEAPETIEPIPLGRARIVREGADLTLVTVSKSVHDALAAAETLAGEGVEVEVIDLRTLRPLDHETVRRSVQKTNRLMVVEEGPRTGGWSGEILGELTETAIEHVDDAWRLTTADLPTPYSPSLEDAFLPTTEPILVSIREHLTA